ncbi:MAG TPA: chromosome segregation protein SMC [Burkholderiales bacterium]|nr:chromosome segregation protein SMC [Burkholderiales bacterium]
MISRIIEAKPEDLRSFLEEAAGVSKYRERRRETELRLQDTRENLLRVDDIRQELGKQLEHLELQAEKAGKYRGFEASLKRTQQLLWTLRKRDAQAQRIKISRDVEAMGIELEAETARLRDAERRVEELRTGHYGASDAVHAAQGTLYEANAEIARLEQQIQFHRDSRHRAEQQLNALRAQDAEQKERQQALQSGRAEAVRALAEASEQLASLENALHEARIALPAAEENYRMAQALHAQAQTALTQAEQQLQLEDTRKGHSDKLLQQLDLRRARLEEERDGLEIPNLSELVRLESEIRELAHELDTRRLAFEQSEVALPTHEEVLQAAENVAERLQQRVHQVDARLTALQSLQDQVSRSSALEPWLDRHGLRRASHLWQGIHIRDGWDDALEAVLRERLNSIGLTDLGQAHGWLAEPPPGKLSFHRTGELPEFKDQPPPGLEPLTDHVTCTDPRLAPVLADWLNGVYVLADPAQGIEKAAMLPPGAMLVSPQGHVFTATSISFHAADSEIHGILARQREIEALFRERTDADARLVELNHDAASRKIEFEERRGQVETLRREVSELQERHHQLNLDHVRLSQLAERLKARGEQIVAELAEIDAESARESAQRGQAALEMEGLHAGMAAMHGAVDQARQRYEQAETDLESSRALAQQIERAEQEALFQNKTIGSKIIDIDSALELIAQTLSRLSADVENLLQELSASNESVLQEQLQQQLAVRAGREHSLKQAREELDTAEQTLRATEQERLASEQKLAPARDRINELRLKEQEARLAEESFASQLAEVQANEEELLGLIEEGMRASKLQTEINRLNEELAALGAVNLAALEELSGARERKSYLDSQSLDLTEAVDTLETAIRKIDRETRERLQDTFDAVNKHFGEMFPALFGGGEAKLLMTGEEILDAGVQVIARPPGKRNASIHLLSGGEKALTALSLVFSMFQLNPAPFCLLDEVDAPLDDSNTDRFCSLVKKMSTNTQFMFITHNKITMEMASQLIGVTMQEQGVSRVVAVDVDEALRMREEAAA